MYEINAHIRNNKTGEVRVHDDSISMYPNGSPNAFIWEEGNYACDCNRSLFFHNWGPESDAQACTETEFSVNLSNKVDGVVFYREFDEKKEVLKQTDILASAKK